MCKEKRSGEIPSVNMKTMEKKNLKVDLGNKNIIGAFNNLANKFREKKQRKHIRLALLKGLEKEKIWYRNFEKN